MSRTLPYRGAIGAIVLAAAAALVAQSDQPAITYVVSFPEPEHHWVEVAMTTAGLGSAPLVVRMSRSSPGRYATHEFAKNIFHLVADDGVGRVLPVSRVGVDEWEVTGHPGTVRIVYRIFGDQADGTSWPWIPRMRISTCPRPSSGPRAPRCVPFA